MKGSESGMYWLLALGLLLHLVRMGIRKALIFAWHSTFAVILGCCCCRFRIPRTKQEIEADYKRKQLAKKFKEKLTLISNTDMENMDLPRGGFFVLVFWKCFG